MYLAPIFSGAKYGLRGSCGAPFTRSKEVKEGVGWCRKSEVRLVAIPAYAVERWGSCDGSPWMARPSKSDLVVAEASRRRGAVSPADHDTAAAEACS